MHLFGKNHVDFDKFCYDAQNLDDNCDFGQLKNMTSSYASSEQANNLNPNAIAHVFIKKMRLETRNHMPNRSYPLRQYSCVTCGENHPIECCPTTYCVKWCNIYRRMTNHETRESYYHPRGDNDARNGYSTSANPNVMEKVRPMLGTKPPLPRMAQVRYVESKMEVPCYDILLAIPYSVEEPPIGYEYIGDSNPNQYFNLMDADRGSQVDAYAKKGPQPSGALRPCFRCHDDH